MVWCVVIVVGDDADDVVPLLTLAVVVVNISN